MALVLNGSNDTITGLQINSANIVDGSIVNADINASAAIAGTKISGGVGKIGQVLQTTKTDTFSLNSSSYSDITGMGVSITPAATTSKVLVLVDLKVGADHGDSDFFMQLLRGSTAIYNGDTSGSRTSGFFGLSLFAINDGLGDRTMRQVSATFLDSPNTTSATNYKIQMQNKGGRTNYINRQGLDSNLGNFPRTSSSITVLEVLA